MPTSAALAAVIDHTLLDPLAGESDIERLCDEARQYAFAACCVAPRWVARVRERLHASPVAVCTVVGFPLGFQTSTVKAFEAARAIEVGATEIDMVMSLGAAKSEDWAEVGRDISRVVEASEGLLVKVILETAILQPAEIDRACRVAVDNGAGMVKTSTGFGHPGATLEAVSRMRRACPLEVGVKASGGIRDRATAVAMLEAGATRLGTSRGVALVRADDHEPDRAH